jgi:protein TorT
MAALAHGGIAHAADKWWPAKIYNLDSGSAKESEYSPLEKAAKPWNICVLFPHMKDTFWVAADYGVVEEARRMGVNMTLGAVRRLHGRQFRRDHRRANFGGRARQED